MDRGAVVKRCIEIRVVPYGFALIAAAFFLAVIAGL